MAVLLTAPGDATVDWNEGASRRWHHFVTLLRRRFPAADLQYWRVAELQSRGLVHFHFVLRGLRFLPVRDSDRGPGLRSLAVQAGFGSYVGVKRPKDYPGKVASAGYYFGKYLLKSYSVTMGVTKLVTTSQRWRVAWQDRRRAAGRGGWLFAGPSHAGWRLLGYEVAPPPNGFGLDPARPSWWRLSWQAVRRAEAPSIALREGAEWHGSAGRSSLLTGDRLRRHSTDQV